MSQTDVWSRTANNTATRRARLKTSMQLSPNLKKIVTTSTTETWSSRPRRQP